MNRNAKSIGLAIVGAGRVGLIRGAVASRHPSVEWIGIAEKDPARGKLVAEQIGADFVTTDYKELLRRHIERNKAVGARMQEFRQVLPSLARSEIQVLLRELVAEQAVHKRGVTRAARYHLGPPPADCDPGQQVANKTA